MEKLMTTGPFKPTEFAPDIPQDAVDTLSKDKNGTGNNSNNSTQGSQQKDTREVTAREVALREQKEKEDWKKRRMRMDQESDGRTYARFAQTDYSSFDSEVIDQNVVTYYCCYCGNYCIATESQLTDCPLRKTDESHVLDISNQIFRSPGLYFDTRKEKIKVIRRKCQIQVKKEKEKEKQEEKNKEKEKDKEKDNTDNDNTNFEIVTKTIEKLEVQYRFFCQSCDLPVAYCHVADRNKCKRIFIINDALSNDPTMVQQKIRQLKHVFDIAKGKIDTN